MSGQEDLQKLVTQLEEIHSDLRSKERSLDETVVYTASAIDLFRRFEKAYSSVTFDVQLLKINQNGENKEVPFDWKTLE